MFSQQAVGYGSAAVSAFTLLGTIGMFGLGTLLIGELPRRNATRAGLVSAALLACALGSLMLGIGFVVVAPHVSSHFAVVMGTPGRAALFVAGSAVTGVTLVFDQATIGLLRGRLQLARNITFAVAKLLVLPAAAIFLHDAFGFGVTAAWVAGMALSLVTTAVWLRFKGTRILPRPHWGILRELGWTAMAHNWLNISIAVPFTLLPVLVTVLVSPAANGAYYIASMLAGFLYVVPAHLSTVLFAVVAGDPQVIARKLRVALRLSFIIGLPGMIVLGAGAHLLLSLFGPGYASGATVPLVLLAIGYPFAVPIGPLYCGMPGVGQDYARSRGTDGLLCRRVGRGGGGCDVRWLDRNVALRAGLPVRRGPAGHSHRAPRSHGPWPPPAPGQRCSHRRVRRARDASGPQRKPAAGADAPAGLARPGPRAYHGHGSTSTPAREPAPSTSGGAPLTGRQLSRNLAVESPAWACFTATISGTLLKPAGSEPDRVSPCPCRCNTTRTKSRSYWRQRNRTYP